MPFEDRQAELHALNSRYILALGSRKGVAIFDREERRCTVLKPDFEYIGGRKKIWCFSENCGSVFLQEWEQKPGFKKSSKIALRQMSADGAIDRKIASEIDFHVAQILVRDDGCIVCVERKKIVAFEPRSEETSAWHFGEHERPIDYDNLENYRDGDDDFRWFSDDARYGVRLNLTPAAIFHPSWRQRSKAARAIDQLLKNMGLLSQSDDLHPDLPGNGTPQRGLAVEIFQLAPIKLMRSIVVRYFPEASFETGFVRRDDGTILSRAELAKLPERMKDAMSVSVHYPPRLHERIANIEWQDNSDDFRVSIVEGTRKVPSNYSTGYDTVEDMSFRTISVTGDFGPLEFVSGEAEPRNFDSRPSKKAINAIEKIIRERSNHHIECGKLTGASVATALTSVCKMMQSKGVKELVFNGQLRFKFRVEGKLQSEKKFFEALLKMPAEAVKEWLPALRELLAFYGAEARTITNDGSSPIMSSASEQGSAALSDAALTLAVLDEVGFDALRDWVVSVDQEHDYCAARKVFPAFAKKTGFKTPEAISFGLWFFLQQWQTVNYGKNWLGLFDQAKQVMTPRRFAEVVAEEWKGVAEFLSEKWAGPVHERVEDVLGADDWSQEALQELDKLRDQGAL
ncbi:MAG: hypothetical protein ABJP34_05905 [Erythrobacter sp.]